MSEKLVFYPSVVEEPGLIRRPIGAEEWQSLRERFSIYAESLQPQEKAFIKAVALSIARNLEELDGIMEALCQTTCPSCTHICCHAKGVFYNEVDLLFLTAYGSFYPPSQTRLMATQHFCTYWEPERGCRLPRLFRPYVCTWFICENQSALLEEIFTPRNRRRLDSLYTTIRHSRLVLASRLPEVHSKNI
jgi:hypothetical protein